MSYVLEIVPKAGRAVQPCNFSDGGIAEGCESVACVTDALGFCNADTLEGFFLYRDDVVVDHDAKVAMLETMKAIDRNAIVVPLFQESAHPNTDNPVPFDSHVTLPSALCVLIRWDLYKRFGPFDKAFTNIADAIFEYGAIINEAGFTTVVCNKAIAEKSTREGFCNSSSDAVVFGKEELTLGSLISANKSGYVEEFKAFADSATSRKLKVLFEFRDMQPFHCGTSEYQLALLKYFREYFSGKYEITVRCNAAAAKFHGIYDYGFSVIMPNDEAGLYDIGLVASQPTNLEVQQFLNEHCLRFAFTMLDCILLRANYLVLRENNCVEDVVRCGLRNCDGIIAISEFSKADFLNYFASDFEIQRKDSRVVYIATDFGKTALVDLGEKIPFESFVLVVGNGYRHKALDEALAAVGNTKRNYVFVGLSHAEQLPSNVCRLPHAELDEAFLDSLYEHCDCVVFPSQYEGFGLPVTIAFKHRKKVIVCNNDLNKEIGGHFSGLKSNMAYFEYFDEIPDLVEKCIAEQDFVGDFSDSWSNAIVEIEGYIGHLLRKPLDWWHIDRRQWEYRLIAGEMESSARRTRDLIGFKYLIWKRFIKGNHFLESLFSRFGLEDQANLIESDAGK